MSDRSRLGTAISLLAAAVVVVQGFAPVTPSVASVDARADSSASVDARAAASNGLLLYGAWRFGTIDGEHVASVKPPVVGAQWYPLALSPAGDQFAYVVRNDGLANESLRTFKWDGTDRLIVHMPGKTIGAFDWAPDGSALAFTATQVVDGIQQSGLYRVAASGGSPVQLVAGTKEVSFDQNSLAADLSWSSRGEIAFLALRCLDECQYSGVDVYTVPAVGGQVERFTPTGSCGAPPAQTPCFSYTSADWSPDGSALAVTYNASPGGLSEPRTTHVGFADRGSATPTSLHGLGEPYTSSDLNGDYCCGMFRNARWSPDQRQIVYSFGFTRFHNLASESYVISAGGGTPSLVNGYEAVQDWQACPGGQCATWAALPDCDNPGAGNQTPGSGDACDPPLQWNVVPRMEDADDDGILDKRYFQGRLSDPLNDGQTVDVVLDACPANVVSWRIGSDVIQTPKPVCRLRFPGVSEGVHTASVTTTKSETLSIQINPQHLMIVGLGDSYGSGEGVPDRVSGPKGKRPKWDQRACHRSRYSAQAQAALRLEKSDAGSAVTFLHLACSGATTYKGVLGVYTQPPEGGKQRAQVAEAAEVTLGNPIDAVFLSLGGNDIGFGNIVAECATPDAKCPLNKKKGETLHGRTQEKLRFLESAYDTLDACFVAAASDCRADVALRVDPSHVFHTEYPDLSGDEKGHFCNNVLVGMTDTELQWAAEVVQQGKADTNFTFPYKDQTKKLRVRWDGLNTEIRSRSNWTPVTGIFKSSRRHGYCSKKNWVVKIEQSLRRQGDEKGTMHPNLAGQTAYGRILAERAITVLGLD